MPACSNRPARSRARFATVDSFQLALFIKNNTLAPIDEYFTKEEIDDLFPFIKAGITGPDNHIYAWWWNTDLRLLYRNKEVVANAPKDWAELKAAALDAASKGKEGVLFNGGRWEGTTFDWLAQFWAQGGKLTDDSGKPIFGEGENRDKMLKALGFYKDLVDSGAAPKRVATIKDYADFNAAAIADTAAMFIGGHWQNFQLKEAMPADQFAKWEASAIPGPTVDERSTGTGGWTVAAFRQGPGEVKFCMDRPRDHMGPANSVMGQLPTRKSLFASLDAFRTPSSDRQRVAGEWPGAARRAVYRRSPTDQIMMGDVDRQASEQALDDAWKAVNDAYAKM
jgi:multiple sugar transport system substrate-binding protein